LEVAYFSAEEFRESRYVLKERLLGAVAFGAERPQLASPDFPFAWIDMPPLGREGTVFEVWLSEAQVVRDDAHGIQAARDEDVLFGCIELEQQTTLDAASYLAYSRIFDFIDSREYGHLLRVWNYFPEINSDTDGLERYQRFCRGRHEAFVAKGRFVANDAPAACALGSRGGLLVVYFLAARQAGQRVENPRQLSAYHYPEQYGPRSPAFSRAMLASGTEDALLFISGTAGIVGHETQHVGNAAEQARETVANILAVIEEARHAGLRFAISQGQLSMKAYLRRAEFLPIVRDALAQAFGSGADVVYLQADICRSDLLLEVEGVYVQPTPRKKMMPTHFVEAASGDAHE
jgi:chorismate lyase / 3-hydroxybenzoate synthase